MLRPTSSPPTSRNDYVIIDVMQQLPPANEHPRRRSEGFSDRPPPLNFNPRPGHGSRRENLQWRLLIMRLIISAILVLVLMFLFVLCWISYPVNLEIKDGRIISDYQIEMPQPLNDTHTDPTILELANPPNASVPPIMAPDNDTEVQRVSESD